MTYVTQTRYVHPVHRKRRDLMIRSCAVALVALCVMSVLGFFTVRHYCYILLWGQRTSDPELVMYRLDDARRLLLGSDAVLLINTQERVVVELSRFGRRLGPVMLWPRDSTRGVVLGDGVKGDVEDSYHFVDGGVDIRYGNGHVKRDLHVTL